MPISTITHKGKKILYADYSNQKTEKELLETLYLIKDYFSKSMGKVPILYNVANAFESVKFMSEAKRINKEVIDPKADKAAIIGVNRLQKILLKGYNAISTQKLVVHSTYQDALEYLVK